MLEWYDAILLTVGALIAGHMWGLLAGKVPLDEAYYAGYDDGVSKGRELEGMLYKYRPEGFWGR